MTWEILAPGTWVIFGVIGLPVYTVLLAWFLGKPRTVMNSVMGVSYLITLITGLWVGLFLITMVIKFVFPPAM